MTVAKPVKKLVADHDEYVGRFVAVDYVEVRARVSGYLDDHPLQGRPAGEEGRPAVHHRSRAPSRPSLDQAKASLAQAQANLAFAESDLKRGEGLRARHAPSRSRPSISALQAKRVAAASVTAQEAAVRQAELDLEFTELTAPVSGRIGDRRVSAGNLVTGGTTGTTTLLATIASIDPIRFEFTMDEASYLRYLRLAERSAERRQPRHERCRSG